MKLAGRVSFGLHIALTSTDLDGMAWRNCGRVYGWVGDISQAPNSAKGEILLTGWKFAASRLDRFSATFSC